MDFKVIHNLRRNPAEPGAPEHSTGKVVGKSKLPVGQHHGLVERREAAVTVKVAPGSGTGELTGISGAFKIANDEEVHSCVLEDEFQ